MWVETKTNQGLSVKLLNNETINVAVPDFGKMGGYVGAAIGILAFFVFMPNALVASIMYLCLIWAFSWGFEKVLSFTSKKKENEIKQSLYDAVFWCGKPVSQIDIEKIKEELGSKYTVSKDDNGLLSIKYKKGVYSIVEQNDDGFKIIADDKEAELSVIQEVYGFIAYHIQKISGNEGCSDNDLFKQCECAPTAKDHIILVAKLLVIFFVIGTIVFQGKDSIYVDAVKNGSLSLYPDKKIGEALEAHCASGKWTAESEDGAVLVKYIGWIEIMGVKQKMEMRFYVFEDETFQVDSIYLGDEELGMIDYSMLLGIIFAD